MSVVGLSLAAESWASIKRATHVDAQGLGPALEMLAKEHQFQVLYRTELVGGLRGRSVNGDLTTDEALRELLDGSGLTYKYLGEKAITIVRVRADAITSNQVDPGMADEEGANQQERTDKEAAGSLWGRFRLAQATAAQTDGRSSLNSESESSSSLKGNELAEIIVTAQKREERLLDVPISIVALGTDELESRKLTSLDDLQFAVPGMAVSTDGVANRIELRGVSSTVGVAPLVGIYLDEVDVTNGSGLQINPDTYDLERVEVLRGPQGTLYGEGSAGGTVRFVTKSPVLDRFGMAASVASTFTQDGSPGERINTAINVPLIDTELGVRIAGTFDREGGWIDQPAAGLKDINGQDLTNVRIKSLWRPSQQFSASFMAEIYRNDRSIGTGDDAAGNFIQAFNLTTTPKVSDAQDIYNLTLTYDFPVAKLLNTTSYIRREFEAKDVGSNTTYPDLPPPNTYSYLAPYQRDRDHTWVEELRLSSIESGPWQWTVGGFYRHSRSFYDQPIGYSYLLGPPGTPLPASFGGAAYDYLHKSWSFFGDINYKLWGRFTLGFGVRSFYEDQEYIVAGDYGSGPFETDQQAKFDSVDPRVYAQYQLSRDINIYASAAKGFRSGGFNVDPDHPTFAPEDVRTYELGTKMALLDGRLHAEASIFYTQYKDYVVTGFANVLDVFSDSLNAGNARIRGVEWNFVFRPSPQWNLGINGNYYDPRFTKINAIATPYEVGDPLDNVPKYQITSSAERDFTWNSKLVSMRLDYTRRGRETVRNRYVGLYGESDVINLLSYSMSLHWSESLSFNLFAQNLLNDRGLTVPVISGSVRSRPRTYGVGFDVSLGRQ